MFSKPERVIDRPYLEWVKQISCIACGKWPSDPHHVHSRGAGGGDNHWNILPVCRTCHSLTHSKGLRYMAKEYIGIRRFLDNNGWTYEEHTQKYIHASDSLPDPGDGPSKVQPLPEITGQV